MKYLHEFRNSAAAEGLLRRIAETVTRPWVIMEVCGGQTHSIVRSGIDRLLPPEVTLVHGPGCPVCVTAIETVDAAIELAARPEVILCSFGDMLRVPGSVKDLLTVKAEGGEVRMVYSPLDAIKVARENPDRQVIFFAVGFETTAPATALAILQAQASGLANFSLLTAHVRVPPAIAAILAAPRNRVQGFLAAGHVCSVMGYWEYEPLAEGFGVPITVTGFEPVDILRGLAAVLQQLEQGTHRVENAYSRVVRREGNRAAQEVLQRVFVPCDRTWRGIGRIPDSGLALAPDFAAFDAEVRFPLAPSAHTESSECQSGLVLQGLLKPRDCPAFGTRCTPEHPLGATMVSSEGACAAYWRYRNM